MVTGIMFERLSMRKHIGCESIYLLRSFATWIKSMFYWIVLIQLAWCSFRCTHSLYWWCVEVHSNGVTAAQNELNEARSWHTHIDTNKCNQVTYVLMLYQLLNWKYITHNYILLYLLQQIHLCNRAVMNVLKIEQYTLIPMMLCPIPIILG